ncbi:MAG: OsmC family protein [Chloroflexi bacterium]|nr:OsmC family protein [Chloroflexota bacterium]
MATQAQRDRIAEAIEATRTHLRQARDGASITAAADTRLIEGFQVEASIRGFRLTIDEPESLGGTDRGPNPVELVLAAFGACQEIVYATYARILGVPIDSVSVKVEGSLDPRGFFGVAEVPAGFSHVTYTVDIQSAAPASEVTQLIATASAHCPVFDILRQPIPVKGTYAHNGTVVLPAS